MQSHQPGWEGTILAFALIFTVLLGVVYAVAIVFQIRGPLAGHPDRVDRGDGGFAAPAAVDQERVWPHTTAI